MIDVLRVSGWRRRLVCGALACLVLSPLSVTAQGPGAGDDDPLSGDVGGAAVQRIHVADLDREIPAQLLWRRDQSPMVLVPAGEFRRGSDSPEDSGGDADESPARQIYLPSFYIDRFEVTNAQYDIFCRATGYERPSFMDTDLYGRPDQPVVGVSYDDANAYARWAGKILPTEAMWEKAARGVDGRLYPWGNELSGNEANTRIARSRASTGVGTHEQDVSPYGAMDMGGNVSEWVSDWYSATYYADAQQRSPAGPPTGERRVVRGGSWNFDPDKARTISRTADFPAERKTVYGFRTVAVPGMARTTPTKDTTIRVGEAARRDIATNPNNSLPIEQQWTQFEENFRGFFESHRPLIETMLGDLTRLYPATDRREVEFVNLTDRTIYVSLVNSDRIVVLYDLAVRVNASAGMRLPVGQTFRLYFIDQDATPTMERLTDVTVGTGSGIQTVLFDLDGAYREGTPRHRTAEGQFREARRELAVVNQSPEQVVFTVTDMDSLIVAKEITVAPGNFELLNLEPGRYRVVAKYVDVPDRHDLTDVFEFESETIRQSVVCAIRAGASSEDYPEIAVQRSVYVPRRLQNPGE